MQFEDNDAIDAIVYGFDESGYFKDLAVNGNWIIEFEEINKEFIKDRILSENITS